MNIVLFLKGILIGIAVAIPVGPIGILCIHRTLFEKKMRGIVTGLGAAVADTIYGFIAACGVSFLSNFLLNHHIWFRLFGGAILCLVGIDLFLIDPRKKAQKVEEKSSPFCFKIFSVSFLITLTNPLTILAFLAIYATLNLGETLQNPFATSLLTVGIFLGSLCWWFTLCTLTVLFKEKISHSKLTWVNKTSGSIVTLLGIGAFFSLLMK